MINASATTPFSSHARASCTASSANLRDSSCSRIDRRIDAYTARTHAFSQLAGWSAIRSHACSMTLRASSSRVSTTNSVDASRRLVMAATSASPDWSAIFTADLANATARSGSPAEPATQDALRSSLPSSMSVGRSAGATPSHSFSARSSWCSASVGAPEFFASSAASIDAASACGSAWLSMLWCASAAAAPRWPFMPASSRRVGAVQPDPLAGQQVTVDGLAEQGVAERVDVHPLLVLGHQHVVLHGLAQRLLELGLGQLGHGEQPLVRRAPAGHRRDPDHRWAASDSRSTRDSNTSTSVAGMLSPSSVYAASSSSAKNALPSDRPATSRTRSSASTSSASAATNTRESSALNGVRSMRSIAGWRTSSASSGRSGCLRCRSSLR